jgi:alcohol dehydrogenase
VRYATGNIVPLPENISSVAAAALGCRVGTSYRAVAVQGAAKPGEWVAIHGCGGAGLSAVMVARALGARVVAIDIRSEPLALAKRLGAEVSLNATDIADIPAAIHELTGRGADLSLDTLGSATTLGNSILSLRKLGRHVQVGHLIDQEALPAKLVRRIIGHELDIKGSHGLQAHAYPGLFNLIQTGLLDPTLLVERRAVLDEAPAALESLQEYRGCGVTIFTPGLSGTGSWLLRGRLLKASAVTDPGYKVLKVLLAFIRQHICDLHGTNSFDPRPTQPSRLNLGNANR